MTLFFSSGMAAMPVHIPDPRPDPRGEETTRRLEAIEHQIDTCTAMGLHGVAQLLSERRMAIIDPDGGTVTPRPHFGICRGGVR